MSQQEEVDRMLGATAPPAKDRLPDRHVRIVPLTPFGEEVERRERCLHLVFKAYDGFEGPIDPQLIIDAAHVFYAYIYGPAIPAEPKSED